MFMDKNELLQELSHKLQTGEVSRGEVSKLLSLDNQSPHLSQPASSAFSRINLSFANILYTLGAAIVIIAIIFFVGQIWEDIGSVGRVMVTFGLGLVLAGIGSNLLKDSSHGVIGVVFHIIAGFLIPGGTMVAIYEFGTGSSSLMMPVLAFVLLAIFYSILANYHRQFVLTFFALANGTMSIYLLSQWLLEPSADFYAYLTMLVGACFVWLAQTFIATWNDRLVGFLRFVGTAAFLFALFTQVLDTVALEVAYFAVLLGFFWLAQRLESRAVLIVATIGLIIHTSYITYEYFSDSVSWPLLLILLGFLFIGIGYYSHKLSQRFSQA